MFKSENISGIELPKKILTFLAIASYLISVKKSGVSLAFYFLEKLIYFIFISFIVKVLFSRGLLISK